MRTQPYPTFIARAPVRIDFGGGWTDVPPYSTEEGGFVCNLAIARHAVARLAEAGGDRVGTGTEAVPLARAALRASGLEGLALTLDSDYPVGAGLGGSSAAGVAIAATLAACRGDALDPVSLAEASRRVEVGELGIAGGRQDHYAAAFGGALALRFGRGDGSDSNDGDDDAVQVRRLLLSPRTRSALERRCIVAYTGEARVSERTIRGVLDAYRAGDPRVTESLRRLRELAEEMSDALEQGDVDGLGALVGEHWVHQRALHPAIPTPRIDALIDAALRAGGIGAKALGASGGGCIVVIAGEGRESDVRAVLQAESELIPFTIADRGVHLLRNERGSRREDDEERHVRR